MPDRHIAPEILRQLSERPDTEPQIGVMRKGGQPGEGRERKRIEKLYEDVGWIGDGEKSK